MDGRMDEIQARAKIEELQKEVQRLRQALELQAEGLPQQTIYGISSAIIRTSKNLTIEYANHATETLFSTDRQALIGRSLTEIQDNLRPPIDYLRIGKLAREDEFGRYSAEFEVKDKADNMRYVRISATVLPSGGLEFVIEDESKLKLIENSFRRYVSPKVIDQLIANRFDMNIARRMDITVLFADLRGFSNICASARSEFMIKQLIDEFLDTMMNIIVEHGATVDKIVGDEVMALFGAPVENEEHPKEAVMVAVEMQKAHEKLMENWRSRGMPAPPLGIGINSGIAIVGNIGGRVRMSYTALGHTVNIANRLCSAARAGEILLSNNSFERVREILAKQPAELEFGLKFRKGPELFVQGSEVPIQAITVTSS